MALIVPILRLMMLLLNIYETFKVLKPPRPSSRRNSGQVTVRALSQRKRNMKGCLAIWIVWCCFMVYERTAEGIVSLFIPFYGEFKSLVLLFLILTRARGAEPIFLHIIRPLLRPYTSTIDALSDVGRMFGDIIFLLLTYPFHAVLSWWHEFVRRDSTAEDEANGRLYTEVQQALHSVSHQMPIQAGGRRRSSGPIRADLHALDGMAAEHLVTPPHAPAERSAQPPTRVSVHQIWHPPRSAYHDVEDDYSAPAPLDPPLESDEARRAREHLEEWRQYPPFPSAYPSTPLPASSSSLPPSMPAISSFAPRQFSPILEDAHQPQQDFGQSLPSPHELPNPGSAKDSSDDDNLLGIQNGSPSNDIGATVFQDDTVDEDDDDDDFNVTLRTPEQAVVVPDTDTVVAPMTRSRAKASFPLSAPALVALPSLLSRMSSETLSVSSDSGSDSLVSRKRSRELVAPADAVIIPGGRVASKRRSTYMTDALPETTEDESSAASSSSPSDEEEVEEDADASSSVSEPSSPLMKKRRVASPPSRVQPRRTTRTTSHEPTAAPPLVARRQPQRQPKNQPPDAPSATAGGRASSRQATSRQQAADDPDGQMVAPTAARPSRRAGRGGTVAAKRK